VPAARDEGVVQGLVGEGRGICLGTGGDSAPVGRDGRVLEGDGGSAKLLRRSDGGKEADHKEEGSQPWPSGQWLSSLLWRHPCLTVLGQ